ncbi:MAG: Mur ligase family protein [Sphaerochaetaceae bacterium]|nr:Mur ligase family protein [Sphaerochaetaceae bacterium]
MSNILLIGIKGSGMSNLALILKKKGNFVFGIDKSDYYQSQDKLIQSNIEIFNKFSLSNISYKIDEIIYSTAYENHELVIFAKKNYKTLSYVEYLSQLTDNVASYAVAGTHGKTTTTAATAFALTYKERVKFPVFSIFGSSLIGKASCIYQGEEAFLLEACEYQNHFLTYKLQGALITSIDYDHPDFFKSLTQVKECFYKFATNLKNNGFLILNVDDQNVKSLKYQISNARKDLNIITYGFNDNSLFRIEKDAYSNKYKVKILRDEYFQFKYQDRTLINDIVGAAILSTCILLDRKDVQLYLNNDDIICDEVFTTLFRISLKALENFNNVKGRIELKAVSDNVIYIDDYAHHPKEIYTLVNELRTRYPNNKLFAIFSPHTASRTKALYKEFISVLLLFDKLIITKTFASARMDEDKNNLAKNLVRDLNKKLLTSFKVKLNAALYVKDIKDVASIASSMVEEGDVVISLGASNNDNLYKEIIKEKR